MELYYPSLPVPYLFSANDWCTLPEKVGFKLPVGSLDGHRLLKSQQHQYTNPCQQLLEFPSKNYLHCCQAELELWLLQQI